MQWEKTFAIVFFKAETYTSLVPFIHDPYSPFVFSFFHFSLTMSSAYGRIPKPQGTSDLSTILPIKKVLRNGIEGYIQQVDPNNKPLVDYLHSRFNKEIEDG